MYRDHIARKDDALEMAQSDFILLKKNSHSSVGLEDSSRQQQQGVPEFLTAKSFSKMKYKSG